MIEKVKHLAKEEKDKLIDEIKDSFFSYPYTEGNQGILEDLDPKHFSYFVKAFVEEALSDGSLYRTTGKEAYMIYLPPSCKLTFLGALKAVYWMKRAYGKNLSKHNQKWEDSGSFLSREYNKYNEPYHKLELLVVFKEYQHKGFMKELLNYAIEEAKKENLPLYFVTDDIKKVAMYEHFGFEMIKEHKISDCSIQYEMLKK